MESRIAAAVTLVLGSKVLCPMVESHTGQQGDTWVNQTNAQCTDLSVKQQLSAMENSTS